MGFALLCFILALALCVPLTIVVRHFGRRLKIYDVPDNRHVNRRIVPRLGGMPIIIAFLLAFGIVFYAAGCPRGIYQSNGHSLLIPLLGGAAGIWLLGLYDDIMHMRARYKLLIQLAIATGVYFLGLQIHVIRFPLWGTLDLGDYALPVTVLWIVGVLNAVNLIDGIDGLCSGIVISALLGIFCLALFFNSESGVLVTCTLWGATLAFFAFFNYPPASIFLGDSGSYFLGFMVATLPIFIAADTSTPNVFHISFVTFIIIPLIDTSLAIVRRLLAGVPVSTPDRGHLHHRLLDKGYTHKKITLTVLGLSLVLVIVGIIMAMGTRVQMIIALLAAAVDLYVLLHLCDIDSLKAIKPVDRLDNSKAVLLRKHLPSFFYDLTYAADWAQIRKVLDEFSQVTDMHSVRITHQHGGRQEMVWSWHMEHTAPGRRPLRLNKTYEVFYNDDGRYCCSFCWNSENDRVLDETDALLEIISEIIGRTCNEIFATTTKKISVG